MGKALGHIIAGTIVSGLGLWQLFNHIKLFSLRPASYVAPVWFPAPRVRYLELVVMLAGGVFGFFGQMFGYSMPFQADGSIPSARLPNHEHAIICAALIIYAGSAMYLDRVRWRGRRTLCMFLLAVVYAQQLLVYHFHSADHAGVEGHSHWFLQAVVASCLVTALLGVGFPQSFPVSLVRSACLALQGMWFLFMGFMWIPSLVAKGCSVDDGGINLRCQTDASQHRAKAIVNLLFGWCVSLMTLIVIALYLYVCRKYPAEATYRRLPEAAGDKEGDDLKADHCGDKAHEFTSLEIEV